MSNSKDNKAEQDKGPTIEDLKKEARTLESELRNKSNPTSQVDSIEESLQHVIHNEWPQESSEYFLRIILPKYVVLLLKRGELAAEAPRRLNNFFQTIIDLILELANEGYAELWQTLARIFSTHKKNFYLKFSGRTEEDEEFTMVDNSDEESSDSEKEEEPVINKRSLKMESAYLIRNIQFFIKKGGFGIMLELLQSKEQKVDMLSAKWIMKAIVRLHEHLSYSFVKKLVSELKPVVLPHILELTDEELKGVSRKTIHVITHCMATLYNYVRMKDVPLIVNKFDLAIAYKFLLSPFLEKRLTGLSDLKNFIVSITRKEEYYAKLMAGNRSASNSSDPYSHICIDAKTMVDWLTSKSIMEHIYVTSVHQELLKRAGEIPRFLALQGALRPQHIDMMWNCTIGKHETIRHIIYSTLEKELIKVLDISHLDYLFEKVASVPFTAYDQPTFLLTHSLTSQGLYLNQNEKDKKWYGLDLWWKIIQDDAEVSSEAVGTAFEYLTGFLGWVYGHEQRLPYVQLCLDNLQKGTAVPLSLRLLVKILESYPAKTEKGGQPRLQTINYLEEESHLMTIFFEDMVRYKKLAHSAASQHSEADLSYAVLQGKSNHYTQIKDRLDFVEHVVYNSELVLSNEQFETLFSCLIFGALTLEERDLAFQFLTNIALYLAQRFPQATGDYLLGQQVPRFDFPNLTIKGYQCVENLFRFHNWKLRKLDWNDKQEQTVLDTELFGIANLWRAALEVLNEQVAASAVSFLNGLHKKLSAQLVHRTLEYREGYIHMCMNYLAEASAHLDGPDRAVNLLKIHRCLALVKTFIQDLEGGGQVHGPATLIKITLVTLQQQKFPVEVSSKDTIGTLRAKAAEKIGADVSHIRLIAAGKDLSADAETLQSLHIGDGHAVHVLIRQKDFAGSASTQRQALLQDKRLLPSSILSRQEYFEQLFQLLNLDANTAQMVWNLLMLLPLNSKLEDDIRNFQLSTHEQPDWNDLLDPRSTFKLLYALQIVEIEMQPKSTSGGAESEAWCAKFVALGGVRHLINILMSADFQDKSKGSKRHLCLALLLKVINYFCIDVTGKEGQEISKLKGNTLLEIADGSSLISRLLEISTRAGMPDSSDESMQQNEQDAEIDVVIQAMNILVACCLSSSTLAAKLLVHPSLDIWLATTLLQCPHAARRFPVASALYVISANSTSPEAHALFFNKLLGFLPQVNAATQYTYNYFVLLNRLLVDACGGVGSHPAALFQELLAALVTKLREHPIVEQQQAVAAGSKDNVLLGILTLIRTLVTHDPSFKAQVGPSTTGGLIKEIFEKCLFDIPTIDRHGPQSPPKCKSHETRDAAFKLLVELAKDCPENFAELAALLMSQHDGGHYQGFWKYQPSAYDKASNGYVGLKNLGATCYMNSLMQQFYMLPDLRRGLLQIDEKPEKKEESTIYQLQTMMAHLQESEKKYYDTRPFCASYKNYDGEPINVGQQQDADEYMNMLFDKLDTLLKASPQEKLLAGTFGGSFSNQLISRDCTHVSEREESFYALSLDIKNKKNILESLELYVQGDMLEGDNKYHCGSCDGKVDALKRCCISGLPDNLIIHLKRFEFDLETMKRIKLTDHCVFPTQLNMEPYTKEGLAKKEGRSVEDLPQRPPSYYQYELAGILVHTGTADYGHYYSYIKERIPKEKDNPLCWYQFNDTVVEPFDEEDIPKSCFGGSDQVTEWDPIQSKQVTKWKSKPYSAYMLFYRRVEPLGAKTVWLPPDDEAKLVPKDIFQEIWQENTDFFRDKHLFDISYFEFVWNTVLLQHAPPVEDYAAELDPNSPWMKSIELGVRFISETLSHAKEKGLLPQYVHQLKALFSNYIPACKWFLERLIDDSTWLKELLLECSVPETSEQYAKLVVHVLSCLAPFERDSYDEEETIQKTKMEVDGEEEEEDGSSSDETETRPTSFVVRFLNNYLLMLEEGIEKHWKRFAHYFMVLRDFAKIGDKERELLLEWNLVRQLGDFYLGSDALTKPKKKKIIPMGEKKNPPKLEFMVGFFSVMVRGCQTEVSDRFPPPTLLPGTSLEMGDKDKKLIFSDTFWKRILSDGINPKECADIAAHLCWENEAVSYKFVDYVTHGINVSEYDKFAPYFELCSVLLNIKDSLHQKRIETFLGKYLVVIQGNLKYRTATRDSIKFLVDLAPLLPPLRLWLYQHISQWLETWLLASTFPIVREEAENLVMALAPSANFKLIEEKKKADKDYVHEGVTEEDKAVVHEIFKKLLALLHSTRRYKAGDPSIIKGIKSTEDYPFGYYKLTGYFRLLKWSVQGPEEKKLFAKYFDDLVQIFTFINQENLPCDENKKELMAFWYTVSEGNEENIQLITQNSGVTNHLFDFFASLNSQKERMVFYNEDALPSFYNLLYLCCSQDKDFVARWSVHTNFYWAVSNMYITSSLYPNCAESLSRIIELASEVPEHREWAIVNIIKSNSLIATPSYNIRYLELVLKTMDDIINFCEQKGLDHLAKLLSEKAMARKDEEVMSREDLESCLRITFQAIQWLVNTNSEYEKHAQQVLQSWDTKILFVDAIIHLANRWSHQEGIVYECYRLLTALSHVDTSKQTLTKVLQSQHLELQEMMEVAKGRGRASHLHHHPQTLPFIGSLCSLAAEQLKEDKSEASETAAVALMAVTWAAFKEEAAPDVLLALLLQAWDSDTAFGTALRECDQAGQYLMNVFRYAPRKALHGDTATVVSRLLPQAISTGNLDVSAVAEELANAAENVLSQCSPSSPSSTQALLSLQNVLQALRLLFVSEEAKSFIVASHADLFERIRKVVAVEGFGTLEGSADIAALLPSFKP